MCLGVVGTRRVGRVGARISTEHAQPGTSLGPLLAYAGACPQRRLVVVSGGELGPEEQVSDLIATGCIFWLDVGCAFCLADSGCKICFVVYCAQMSIRAVGRSNGKLQQGRLLALPMILYLKADASAAGPERFQNHSIHWIGSAMFFNWFCCLFGCLDL